MVEQYSRCFQPPPLLVEVPVGVSSARAAPSAALCPCQYGVVLCPAEPHSPRLRFPHSESSCTPSDLTTWRRIVTHVVEIAACLGQLLS